MKVLAWSYSLLQRVMHFHCRRITVKAVPCSIMQCQGYWILPNMVLSLIWSCCGVLYVWAMLHWVAGVRLSLSVQLHRLYACHCTMPSHGTCYRAMLSHKTCHCTMLSHKTFHSHRTCHCAMLSHKTCHCTMLSQKTFHSHRTCHCAIPSDRTCHCAMLSHKTFHSHRTCHCAISSHRTCHCAISSHRTCHCAIPSHRTCHCAIPSHRTLPCVLSQSLCVSSQPLYNAITHQEMAVNNLPPYATFSGTRDSLEQTAYLARGFPPIKSAKGGLKRGYGTRFSEVQKEHLIFNISYSSFHQAVYSLGEIITNKL